MFEHNILNKYMSSSKYHFKQNHKLIQCNISNKYPCLFETIFLINLGVCLKVMFETKLYSFKYDISNKSRNLDKHNISDKTMRSFKDNILNKTLGLFKCYVFDKYLNSFKHNISDKTMGLFKCNILNKVLVLSKHNIFNKY